MSANIFKIWWRAEWDSAKHFSSWCCHDSGGDWSLELGSFLCYSCVRYFYFKKKVLKKVKLASAADHFCVSIAMKWSDSSRHVAIRQSDKNAVRGIGECVWHCPCVKTCLLKLLPSLVSLSSTINVLQGSLRVQMASHSLSVPALA